MRGINFRRRQSHDRIVEMKRIRDVLNDPSEVTAKEALKLGVRLRSLEKKHLREAEIDREARESRDAERARMKAVAEEQARTAQAVAADSARMILIEKTRVERVAIEERRVITARAEAARLDLIPKCWEIPGYSYRVDRNGRDIHLWDLSRYRLVGQTTSWDALEAMNSGGAITLDESPEKTRARRTPY